MSEEDTSTEAGAKESPKPFVHFQKHEIAEVMNFFAKDFQAPAGMEIRNVIAHYDPRSGTVIFEMYMAPVPPTPRFPEQ